MYLGSIFRKINFIILITFVHENQLTVDDNWNIFYAFTL